MNPGLRKRILWSWTDSNRIGGAPELDVLPKNTHEDLEFRPHAKFDLSAMGCQMSLPCCQCSCGTDQEEKGPLMGMPPKTKTQAGAGDFEMMRPQAHTLAKVASDKTLFDAHCHYLNYLQQTEGVEALVGAMDKAGIGFAVLTGTAFKKMWVGADQPMPQHFLYDDGDLYHYSMTDGLLTNDLKMAYDKGKDFAVNRFAVMACGFNLGARRSQPLLALHPTPPAASRSPYGHSYLVHCRRLWHPG